MRERKRDAGSRGNSETGVLKRSIGGDENILARGKLLRMIGDDHLLEEGALVL